MAQRVILSIDQGTDTQVSVFIKDSTGTAIDLTGASARMQLRTQINAPEVVDELTTANSRIVISDQPGTLSLIFPNGVTTDTPAGTYVYDLEMVDSDGLVSRVMEGTITIRPEVTRNDSEESDASE